MDQRTEELVDHRTEELIDKRTEELVDHRTEEELIDMRTAELTDMRTEEENKLLYQWPEPINSLAMALFIITFSSKLNPIILSEAACTSFLICAAD
jgi:hypothetical protein